MANRKSVEATIVSRALKDPSYKQKLIDNADFAKSEIEKETGEKFPADATISVLQESSNTAILVIPYVSEGTQMSEEDLEKMASGVEIVLPCTFGSITFH